MYIIIWDVSFYLLDNLYLTAMRCLSCFLYAKSWRKETFPSIVDIPYLLMEVSVCANFFPVFDVLLIFRI